MAELSLQHVDKIYDNNVQAVFDFNLEVKDKELKRDNKTEENKEKKKRKKGKFGKAFGICAVITIAAGAGIYAYDFIEKNYKNEDTKVEDSNGTVLKENQPVIEKIVMID